MRDDQGRLQDILEAIERIEKYAVRGKKAFDEDELLQTWVVHNIQIIGEAVRNVTEGLKKDHPEVPWQKIVTMRNVLVHEYFTVDPEEVWAAVNRDIPALKRQLEAIQKE